MDENEIKAVSEAMEQLRQGGTISAETLQKLGGTTQTANKALAGYTQKLLGVTGAMGGMAKSVSEGEGSFKSLGGTIVGLTSVVGKLASALPLVGGAAKALAEGVGEASKFILDQLDIMARNYQTLGDASAGAADGVDGLLRQFNQMGNYSLPAFAKAVKNNTIGLAAFQGTAAQGAEELSKVAGELTKGDVAKRFLKLGISLDSVGDATAAYLADSARYGITQGQTTDELTKKTQNYIVEVDKIARLTGQTREAQAKEAQKSLADAKFRAKLAEMTASGEGDRAEQLRMYVEGLGGAAGDAARALVTGIPLTKDAANANLFANDAIRQNTLAIQEGKKATDAVADTQQALADGSVRFNKQIQYSGDVFGGVALQGMDALAIIKEQNKAENAGLTRQQVIDKMQKKQMDASGKTTEQFTDAQLATAGAAKDLQALGFTLAEKAIPAVDAFATGLKDVTGYMDEKFGSGKKGGAGGKQEGKGWWEKTKNVFGIESKPATGKELDNAQAKVEAEKYLGKEIKEDEFKALIKATHAEAQAGKGADQREQAMIMASILNRAREDKGGILGALSAKNQFQSVTGTAANGHAPSREYLVGPQGERLKSIESAASLLSGISKEQKNFTAASSAAYGAGTNIGYRDKMLANGGTTIGGSVFQTAPNIAGPTTKYNTNLAGDPSANMPKAQQEQPTQTANNKSSESDSMSKDMAELIALQRQSNALQAKILQQAKAA